MTRTFALLALLTIVGFPARLVDGPHGPAFGATPAMVPAGSDVLVVRVLPGDPAVGVQERALRLGAGVLHEVEAHARQIDRTRPPARRRPVDDPAEPAVRPQRPAGVVVAVDESVRLLRRNF
nr:hypothetical protein [Nocardiopsis halophila]